MTDTNDSHLNALYEILVDVNAFRSGGDQQLFLLGGILRALFVIAEELRIRNRDA